VPGDQIVAPRQAVTRRVMRLAARAIQDIVGAAAQHQVRHGGAVVHQMRRPGSDALFDAFDIRQQQVVVDQRVLRQWLGQRDIDKVNVRIAPDWNDAARVPIHHQPLLIAAMWFQHQREGQRRAADQPKDETARFEAAQQGTDEDGWEAVGGVYVDHADDGWL
jgi:hypothetical protein